MRILALDTASALSSVALVVDDEVVVADEHLDARGHAEALGPLLAAVRPAVDPSRLDLVVCGVGPGPYTGLRVGIAAGIAFGAAWGVPVVGVCSLDAVAQAVRAGGFANWFGVALDARRREVYWAAYDAAGGRVAGPQVGPATAIDAALRSGAWAGAAADAGTFGRVLADASYAYPHAAWLARRAAADDRAGRAPLPPRPLYLRQPDVTLPGGGR